MKAPKFDIFEEFKGDVVLFDLENEIDVSAWYDIYVHKYYSAGDRYTPDYYEEEIEFTFHDKITATTLGGKNVELPEWYIEIVKEKLNEYEISKRE